MKTLLIAVLASLLLLFLQDSDAVTLPKTTTNPLHDFATMVREDNPEKLDECAIMKIEGDFDDNGKSDYMLSTRCQVFGDSYPVGRWGNAGGVWAVYLNIQDEFVLYPSVFFHPLAYHYQSVGREGAFNLLLYWRSNAVGGVYSITQYSYRYNFDDDSANDGELLFSEEVSRENGYEVSQKNQHLIEGRKSVDAVQCNLDSFINDSCDWKDSYCRTIVSGKCKEE